MREGNSRSRALFYCWLVCGLFPLALSGQMRSFPPHWWMGMENDTLEIIVYDEEGFRQSPQVNGNAKLIRAEAAPNPHYYFLTFIIPDYAENAGIRIVNGGHEIFVPLKKRQPRNIAGISQADAIYLITPDRFANGDTANDSLPGMQEKKYGRQHPYGRHGGDIQGIIDKLPYIDQMGFNSLWISPLLTNDQPHESYHGYAITDHYAIDPRFGDLSLFGELMNKMKQRKMKMIMDVVYNHVGTEHLFFREIPDSNFFNFHPGREDAYLQTNYRAVSLMDPHASQADRHKFTDGWFVRHMPDLNQRHPTVARYLIQNALWWIEEFALDAFRIDTYAYPDQAFMKKLVGEVKRQYPAFFIFAETWVSFPEIQAFFGAGYPFNAHAAALDGLTDFQFYYGINEALSKKQDWASGVANLYYRMASDYLYTHPEGNVTFLDNHDLARIYGVLNENTEKLKSALSILFTMRGIPCMYYGTEILMKETANHGVIRQDFPGGWPGDSRDKFQEAGRTAEENEVYRHIEKLLAWRKNSPALREGKMIHYIPQGGVYVYGRLQAEDRVVVIFNSGAESASLNLTDYQELWPEGSRGIDPLSGREIGESEIVISPYTTRLLQIKL